MNEKNSNNPSDSSTSQAGPVLQIISGHDVGKRLKVNQPAIVGRATDSDLSISDRTVSRHHMIVRPVGGGLMIRDLGSRNGVYLNGSQIKDDVIVKHGDVILIGETFISVQYPKHKAQEKYGPKWLVTVSTAAAGDFDEISAPDQIDRNKLSQKDLNVLMEVLSLAREEEDQVTSLRRVTRRLIELFRADSAVLCLASKGDFEPAIIQAKEKKTHLLTEILQTSLIQRKGVLVQNVFEPSVSLIKGKIPRNMPACQMSVPFIDHDRIVGLLALGSKTPEQFHKGSLDLLTVLANQLSSSVAKADKQEHPELIHSLQREGLSHPIIGESEAMKDLRRLIDQVAHQQVTVIITGETGTGKELVARCIHDQGVSRDAPYICVNCAAVPHDIFEAELFGYEKGAFTGAYRTKPGKFELASHGTLFFDEIGELPANLQAKLLRVIETQEFSRLGGTETIKTNARFLFATNRNLRDMVKKGSFREDLFFRINTLEIHVPPLRERMEDIPEISDYFLDQIQNQLNRARPFRFSSSVLGSFLAYHWPGNVRELRNVLEQMAILSDSDYLDENLLPQRIRVGAASGVQPSYRSSSGLLSSVTDQTQKQLIVHALKEAGGQKKKAAKILGISRPTLDKKVSLYHIDLNDNEINGD